MRSSLAACLLALPAVCFAALPLPSIELPKDGPVALLSSDYTGSNETARGSAMVQRPRMPLITGCVWTVAGLLFCLYGYR